MKSTILFYILLNIQNHLSFRSYGFKAMNFEVLCFESYNPNVWFPDIINFKQYDFGKEIYVK